MSARIVAQAALVDGAWREAVAFLCDSEGTIEAIEPDSERAPDAEVLVPGIHNAHSHAFQWAMRGRTQALTEGHESDDFWSWRDHMYRLAETVTPERMYAIAREAYATMRAQGYVSVGEFHYLHHAAEAKRPWAMATALADAARDVGLPITLVPVAYHRGGHGKPAAGAQKRFCFQSASHFLAYVEGMRADLAGPGVHVGVGVHSVRAVPASWLRPIADAAAQLDRPFHIHVCEQRAEIRECIAEHGVAPIALLEREGALSSRTVLVHATHLEPGDIERIVHAESIVCACPSTESDLGDGFVEARRLLLAGGRLCVGSDSHVVVDPAEELAMLERRERLRYERRNVLTTADELRPARTLLRWGAQDGAAANGLRSGRLCVGERFDALALPSQGLAPDEALDHWLFVRPTSPASQVWTASR